MRKIIIVVIISFLSISIFAQTFDKGEFEKPIPGFYYKVIMRDILGDDDFSIPDFGDTEYYKMDFEQRIYPVHIEDYETVYHSLPISQGNSGTCWAYSATSFMESEAYRISGVKVDISELYTVYWDYVERAQEFVRTKGETSLGEGSEANAIIRVMRNHGMMPLESYNGLKDGQTYNNHRELFEEMESYLKSVESTSAWDETVVVNNIKKILDEYIGTPLEKFKYQDKVYTPQTFMKESLKLNPGEYFSFMSTKEYPYNEKHELVENDNWWHSKDYYNISLDDYIKLLQDAISAGYSISLCGDVSEPGYDKNIEVGVVPSFDIPSEYINEDSRQLRLSNGTTTDDHCIHIVGYQKTNDAYWYLIKDSGSGAFDGRNKGYRFYHEDYIKLKMMNYMVHVDVARPILDNIIKK